MTYIRASEDELEKSIRDFSEGNSFSLFKLVLPSLWDANKLLKDPPFILNMLRNLGNKKDIDEFIDLLIEKYINLTEEYTEGEPNRAESHKAFWNFNIPPSTPLIFHMLPYLDDDQLVKILQFSGTYDSFRINAHKFARNLHESFFLKLIEKKYTKSLSQISEDYFIKNTLQIYEPRLFPGYDEPLTMSELIFKELLKDLDLLEPYLKFTNIGVNSVADTWFTNKIAEDKRNNGIINKFLNTVFPTLEEKTKNEIIAETLNSTDTTDFLMTALKNYGCNNLRDYVSTNPEIPVWVRSGSHKDNKIYRKLIRSGVDIFDYYPPSNSIFIGTMVYSLPYNSSFKELLTEQKIEYETYIKRLFETRTDKEGKSFTNFSAVINTGDHTLCRNLAFPLADLEHYSKKFNPERYSKLKISDKLSLVNEVMNKSFLAKTYIPTDLNYPYGLKKYQINLNVYFSNNNDNYQALPLVDEHLSLLEQTPINKHDYRKAYFPLATVMFDFYAIRRMNPEDARFKTVFKILDYIATDKTLDWKKVEEHLNSESVLGYKNDFGEGAKYLYNHLNKICLSHSLTSSNNSEQKKLKI